MANLQAIPPCMASLQALHPPPQSRSQVIVVYRDGVSESFYDEVLATEFTAIKEVRLETCVERPWVPSLHSGAAMHAMHAAQVQVAVNSLLQSALMLFCLALSTPTQVGKSNLSNRPTPTTPPLPSADSCSFHYRLTASWLEASPRLAPL